MATQLNDYYAFLKSADGQFTARPHYESESDSLIFYARDEPSYAKRINNLLTLYLSTADNRLVGCEIKGVQRILRIGGEFGIFVRDEKIKLGAFVAFVTPLEDLAFEQYEAAVRQFEDIELDCCELLAA